MTAHNAVAIVDPPEEGIRQLPVAPSAHRLAMSLPSLDELKVLELYGRMFAESGLFPQVGSWQAAAAIIQYGSQLGIDAFTSLKDIYWIKGKPGCDASLINSLIKRDHGGDALMPVEATAERCTIRFKRREWDRHEELTVTADQYQHLIADPTRVTWKTNRQDMLWARCVSTIGRRHFPDTVKGLYTREELRDAEATEATYRVVRSPGRESLAASPEPEDPPSSDPLAPSPAALDTMAANAARESGPPARSGNAGRVEAMKALNAAVRTAYGTDADVARDFSGITGKQVRDDLLCRMFGLGAAREATADQIDDAAVAVAGWTPVLAQQAYLILEALAGATNLDMVVDVYTVAEGEGIDDPFVLAAIERTKKGYEAEMDAQMGAVDSAVSAKVVP